jgi:hypothetical protein
MDFKPSQLKEKMLEGEQKWAMTIMNYLELTKEQQSKK